jgi:hypothetical protein
MIESLLEAIDRILSDGKVSWGAIITALLFFNKIQRNKEFRIRDKRVERNQQRIMEKLGVEGEWHVERLHWSKRWVNMSLLYLRTIISHAHFTTLFTRQPAIKKLHWRKTKMKSKLLSRKFWLAILTVVVPVINVEFGIHLDTPTIIAIIAGISSAILGFAHVDAKVAQNVTTPAQSDPNKFIQG